MAIVDAIRAMMGAGFSTEQALFAAELMEREIAEAQASPRDVTGDAAVTREPSAGALRTRRYRERMASKLAGCVTGDVTVTSQGVTVTLGDAGDAENHHCDVTSVTVTSPVTEALSLSPEAKKSPTPPEKTQTSHPIIPSKKDPLWGSKKGSPSSPSQPPRLTDAAIEIDFAEFWRQYPRKVAKGQARKAYATARRKGVAAVTILNGVMRYAADPGREAEFTKHAATWLNAEGWDDEPLPRRNRPHRPMSRTDETRAVIADLLGGNHEDLTR